MLSKKDVERTIEGCNVVTVRAGAAEPLVVKSPSPKMIPRMMIGAVIVVKTVMRAVWACLTERMRIKKRGMCKTAITSSGGRCDAVHQKYSI
jgi:hypothetical protein